MSDIKTTDLRILERAFSMESGYVLDFSNRTLSEFFQDELNLDIDDPRWAVDGTSKARRLRRFLRDVDNNTAAKVIEALWRYRMAGFVGSPDDNCEGPVLELIARLSGRRTASTEAPPTPATKAPQIAELRDNLVGVWSLAPHARGLAFETFLTRAFDLYGLKARDRFRQRGEEVDGSFELNGAAYLLEAKWHANPIGAADLHVFEGKLSQRAQWARGLFVSYSGFSPDGLVAFGRGKRTICMDGQDFDEMLARQLPLDDVITAKARAAVEIGQPFVPVRDLRL